MPAESTVERYILECSELARQLDSLSSRDDRRAIAAAVEQGRKDYESLRRKADTMAMTAPEASLARIMLDGLMARLKFLEKRV